MNRLLGKIALVTGAARGQGRSHAVRLAEEGAAIIAIDICSQIVSSPIPMSSADDLAETARLVESTGAQVITGIVDIRDEEALTAFVDSAVGELGGLDIVSANAGICSFGAVMSLTLEQWRDCIDTNLTGSWLTCKASVPHMVRQGRGGAIILTGSLAGVRPLHHMAHYIAAKHGEIGLAKSLALELAPHMIRVNVINPSSVDTPMIHNDPSYRLFAPDLASPTREDVAPRFQAINLMPRPWLEPGDISDCVLFLASDEARYITGAVIPVDLGASLK